MTRMSLHAAALLAVVLVALGGCQNGDAPHASPPPDDNLNAVLWAQRAVEAKGNAQGAYALATIRLDEALADRSRTAAPAEQTGNFERLPPAIVLDVDETVLDTMLYQAWTVREGQSFSPGTWTKFVNTETSKAVPGAVAFTNYADKKGVKVFYVTNRTKEEEPATRANMTALGFPMGGNVDTILTVKEEPDWGSAKSTRRAVITKDYRILLLVGDNLGDFTDDYKGDDAARLKVYDDNAEHWGRDWIVIANPTYGSFESAPFNHDFKLSPEARRAAKENALEAWPGP